MSATEALDAYLLATEAHRRSSLRRHCVTFAAPLDNSHGSSVSAAKAHTARVHSAARLPSQSDMLDRYETLLAECALSLGLQQVGYDRRGRASRTEVVDATANLISVTDLVGALGATSDCTAAELTEAARDNHQACKPNQISGMRVCGATQQQEQLQPQQLQQEQHILQLQLQQKQLQQQQQQHQQQPQPRQQQQQQQQQLLHQQQQQQQQQQQEEKEEEAGVNVHCALGDLDHPISSQFIPTQPNSPYSNELYDKADPHNPNKRDVDHDALLLKASGGKMRVMRHRLKTLQEVNMSSPQRVAASDSPSTWW